MSLDTVWQEALLYIQGKVPKQVYDTWFIPVRLDRIENSTAHIGVPNKFFGEWLDTHYGSLLVEAMATARGGGLMAVAFTVREKGASPQGEPQAVMNGPRGATQSKPRRGIQLNPKYTFKNFVVGAGNQFAHAACMAVAEQPGHTYNPLFIYGGVGLGKTHLLNAIGNHVAEKSDLRIAYLTT
jgi:chromosomal replication initiator protein